MSKDKPFDILDATAFYEDRRVSTHMRQLYRMGYANAEAERIFKTWLTKRGHKIVDVPTVEEME